MRLEEDVQIALDSVTVIRRLRKLFNITVKYEPKGNVLFYHPRSQCMHVCMTCMSVCVNTSTNVCLCVQAEVSGPRY